ncbi:hypothetical protein HYX16_04350 [Candidatus Woesearchaeota archaeon]|nr:hypothetical protein [Candidatus Woesearchaeota archaeon]
MNFSKDIFKTSKAISTGMFDEIIRVADSYNADKRSDFNGKELRELKGISNRCRQYAQVVFEPLRDGDLDGCIENLKNLVTNIDSLIEKLKDVLPGWNRGKDLKGKEFILQIYFPLLKILQRQ